MATAPQRDGTQSLFCCPAQEGGTLASPSKVMGTLNSLAPLLRRGRGQSWGVRAHGQKKHYLDLSVSTKGQRRGESDQSPEQEEGGGNACGSLAGRG